MKIKHALGIGIAGCLALATLPAFGLGGTKEVAPADAGITPAAPADTGLTTPAAPADAIPSFDPRSGGVTGWVSPESEFFESVDLDKEIAQAKELDISDRSMQALDPNSPWYGTTPTALLTSAFLEKATELPGPTYAGAYDRWQDGIAETWWKGKAPAYVYDLVPKAKEAGIEFIIHEDAKFSRIELKEAVERLQASPITEALNVSSYGLDHTGAGINIYFAAKAPHPLPIEELRKAAGINCDFFYKEDFGEWVLDAARNTDAAPFSGGARINFSYSGRDVASCTSGFPVLKGGVGYLTTANHCDPTNKKAVTNGVGTLIAKSSHSGMAAIDTKLIDPIASPATGPYIYTGPPWNSSKKSRITSVNVNNVGQTVCLSGATSGRRCGTITDDAYPASKIGLPGLVGNWYIYVEAPSGWAAASGDSGGAWYRDNGNGTVQARGGHIASIYGISCSGLAPDVSATCRKHAMYVPATVIQNSLNVKIER